MKKDSTLTAADLDNIVTENFAPDIKKLAHEVGANLDNPVALQAIGASEPDREPMEVDRHTYCQTLWQERATEGDGSCQENLRGW